MKERLVIARSIIAQRNAGIATVASNHHDRTPRIVHLQTIRRRAYLSGPMTGHPDHNVPAFGDAARTLRSFGIDVFNPAEGFGGRLDLAREVYMRKDIAMILECGFVVTLLGWEHSIGARLEVDVARAIGLPIVEYDDILQHGIAAISRAMTSTPHELTLTEETHT